MSDFKPRTRTEQFLAAATGDYTGELPKPITREQEYLEKLVALLSNGSGSGGGSVDLSAYAKKEEVAQAIESAHTHENKDFLDGIEAYLNSTYSKVTAERESADNNLATRIKALEDSVGNISTVLATMVEV